MSSIEGKRVLVTGGSGFLGQAVCPAIQRFKPAKILVPRSAIYDLREKEAVRQALDRYAPDVVIHPQLNATSPFTIAPLHSGAGIGGAEWQVMQKMMI